MHLAQVNIGRVLGGPDDPRLADFYNNLARVNAMAERMPGFVWRLKNESGESAVGLHWPGDESMAEYMSVWETADDLGRVVFQTVHRSIYARKHEFFEMPKVNTVAMWWVEPGHVPTVAEAKERLDHLNTHGPSDFAFGWADLPSAKLFLEKKCA